MPDQHDETQLPFEDVNLVEKYGSWVRVQVAFYDFIFKAGTQLCAKHWKGLAIEEAYGQFADGGGIYERSVKGIERAFPDARSAWEAFMKAEQGETKDA